jgi:hypothetical protein
VLRVLGFLVYLQYGIVLRQETSATVFTFVMCVIDSVTRPSSDTGVFFHLSLPRSVTLPHLLSANIRASRAVVYEYVMSGLF